jgi:hypothetical protein
MLFYTCAKEKPVSFLEVSMQIAIGYLLIIVGVGMEIVSLLVWFGVLKPATNEVALRAASFWDVLLELAKRAPWPAVVGLLNIYAGLKLIGVTLPF